jgi:hypothetical protein
MIPVRAAPMMSVYREVGLILRRGVAGCEAVTADDRSVGVFKDDQSAALELWGQINPPRRAQMSLFAAAALDFVAKQERAS